MTKKTSNRALKMVEEAAETLAAAHVEAYLTLAALCESPIEELMLAALHCDLQYPPFMVATHWYGKGGRDGLGLPAAPFPALDCHLQAQVLNYRADFLLDYHDERGIRQIFVVECDGHDFHERTKEQARRDRKRDREMMRAGVHVIRFTGSEIYADPEACAQQVVAMIDEQVGRVFAQVRGA